ncbi:carbohydrate porin [Phormidium sp. LEGE 05292]|uniref:iron uptake porin n=1 Tax=[Phormidium] sp. LEGE 05292 TaxID=767427 RepID=UPI00187FAAC8|nr:iron uptake porin [Phormidium sp. LEGE 05292]MBE9224710.1 carbohydrate porin [Phormidium sp. LEGE 05292]
MNKLLGNALPLSIAVIVNGWLISSLTQAAEISENTNSLQQIVEYAESLNSASETTEDSNSSEQVTSVSQLRDVQPTDWAFQALQSLVERYGCIEGYPDQTYRGNRAMTRYEFAAGLNSCLDRIQELIAALPQGVSKEDLDKLRRLQEEFAVELANLRGSVNALEARVNKVESQQFSTTTKLGVEVIAYLSDAFGERAGDVNQATLGYRTRIDFNTSFTGKDRLRTRLQATNLRLIDTGATYGGNFGLGTAGLTGETRFTPSSVTENSQVTINQLQYRFPVGDRLTFYLDAASIDPSFITDPISPFIETATGALSNFGQVNPVYFPIGNQAGIGANFLITKGLSLDFAYLGEGGNANQPSLGFFNGGYSAFAQLVYSGERLKFGLLYLNSYSREFGVDTLAGSNAAKVIGAGPVVGNNYGFQANYRFSPNFELGGWVGYTAARALGIKGDAEVLNYAATFAFPDLLKKGNYGGFVFGMQPKLISTSNAALAAAIGLPDGERSDRNTGFHIEAFYRIQLNDYISITPGFFWLTAPNHDARNPDAIVGVIRTSFVF